MDDERFDDETRQRAYPIQKLVLKDGREYTYESIFKSLLNDGIKEDDMEYVMQKILDTPKIAFEYLVSHRIKAQDIKPLIERRKAILRSRSQEIKIQINGIFGENPAFCENLLRNGTCINLK